MFIAFGGNEIKQLLVLSIVMLVASAASAGLLTDPTMDTAVVVKTGNSSPATYAALDWYTSGDWATSGGVASNTSGNQQYIWQGVAIPEAGDYTLTFDYTGSLYAWALVCDTSTWFSTTQKETMAGLTQIAAGGTTGSLDFTITPQHVIDKSYLFVAIRNNGGAATTLENVDIAPEPATMSLLGLGGLALLRRRRR